MRSFLTLALILPSVLAAPFNVHKHVSPQSFHQGILPTPFTRPTQSPPCIIAGITYPNPHHTLTLLGKREIRAPTGISERAFTDFLLLCHKSGGRSRSSSAPLIARHQGSYLSNALGDPAGSDDTTTPGDASSGDSDRSASPSAASPSGAPATTTSSTAPSPSETPGSTTAGSTSTDTPAGDSNDALGTPANAAGSPPSGYTAAITDPAVAQPDSSESALDTSTPQGLTTDFSDSFVDSNVSSSFGDVSGSMSDPFGSFDDVPVDDVEEGNPVAMHAQGGV
ncbi:uncharacterized protein EDB93DRAFT_597899 [Suillus bovinus]|uniref:uncharacterized protein n=1 Tax=Suillus bovinus TaxID=48563 RepID=UPI001B8705BF|nr:uncharacterized protein EDB93DRAFT_597899 [Suillus bovinus]KAG2142884.1 hypothetical protein EDB93DRAFT_597899 [Suillus bovinus]